MQLKATGKVIMKAVAPVQRCRTGAHDGTGPAPGRRPHIHRAVTNWTTTRRTAAVVSHAFIWSMPEKPNVTTGRPLGVWIRAYRPMDRATAALTRSRAARPACFLTEVTWTVVDITGSLLPELWTVAQRAQPYLD